MPSLLQIWALPMAVIAIANVAYTWLRLVNLTVPDPYLDEVFHVPQAQRYCNGDYTWDPKITTPPGLYAISLLFKPIIGNCDTSSLRALNAGAICLICVLAYDIRRNLRIRGRGASRASKEEAATKGWTAILDAHTALNTSLFPPLFFFSGLYYTDVVSTLLVLFSYNTFLKRGTSGLQVWQGIAHVLIGISALSMRQTNICWVAIFPAGLALVDALKTASTKPASDAKPDAVNALKRSWTDGYAYDPPASTASLQDYAVFVLSTAIAALRSPILAARVITPHILLLGLFAGFVAWNGGVVLGDKSNHVATVHTPQMLYIWPYINFFSLPLTLSVVLGPIVRRLPKSQTRTLVESRLIGQYRVSAPSFITAVLFLTLGTTAVHFNTIVHPFTLADNRHYVFYVFRILQRHPAIKFLAVPVYYICAWAAIQTVGLGSRRTLEDGQRADDRKPAKNEAMGQPCQSSFILIWLATTALSVISAPLVEPRYFIIPWIMWRLHVPSIATASHSRSGEAGKTLYDIRLILETVWLLAINIITGYTFLYREFTWLNEPMRVQRFLW
ncbi:alpha-2-glucosyltransferase Alg10 [Lophiotrema nucula]|uniref:Dol-P-Glc:Glc(2)Man(9)GlcNAc(2)-PP-Dol alpha-1,2-glucosyltransferase n=1 Tax=Lophiotrema nucula TaxID=690887 RepID=A0A6A5ZFV6_9PLEO|nr:alpha-2-glucosyltransferase Alg10 [Lophiotrema nucula]